MALALLSVIPLLRVHLVAASAGHSHQRARSLVMRRESSMSDNRSWAIDDKGKASQLYGTALTQDQFSVTQDAGRTALDKGKLGENVKETRPCGNRRRRRRCGKKRREQKEEEDEHERQNISMMNPDPKVLVWDRNISSALGNMMMMFGWLKVPLSHDVQENIYDTQSVCLRVRGFVGPPSPKTKSLLFQHCGGPGSGRSCALGGSMWPKILADFDVITMNQRGHDLHQGIGKDVYDPSPPPCPFKDNHNTSSKLYPVLACDELQANLDKLPGWLSVDDQSSAYKDVVLPMLKRGILRSIAVISRNETLVRWAYRILKLEYELCYAKAKYQFTASASQRKKSAFDLVGTSVLAHDINVFRKALGYEKLSCWGVSYGTRVCGTFATIFPEQISRLILDSNNDPRPDIHTIAEEDPMGPMAVFRGITAACEATLTADDKKDVCPLAPFMAEKLHKVVNGNDKKMLLVKQLFNMYATQKDVPCSAVMISCMSWVIKGGPKPAGCNTSWGARMERHVNLIEAASSDAFKVNMQDGQRDDAHSGSGDRHGLAAIYGIRAVDTHGRLTEEGVITWWKDAVGKYTFGLELGLLTAIGIGIWPALATPVPPNGDAALEPLLVGNLRDYQTSYVATQRMKQGFPQGHLLTYQGYGHGLQAGATHANSDAEADCFKHVEMYLFNGTLPEDGTTCAVLTTAKVSEAEAIKLAPKC